MKLQLFILIVSMGMAIWWLFRSHLAQFKARLARAIRVAGLVYLAVTAVRLAAYPPDSQQLHVAALSLAFFGALWVVAWLATRPASGDQK